MKTVKAYFNDYDQYHRTPGNKITHVVGISIIVIAVFGILFHVSPWLAAAVFVAANAFYLVLNFKLGLSMLVSTGIFFFLGTKFTMQANWLLFVVGWIFQAIGHIVYEKKSPAFVKNGVHLIIGPAYLQNYFLKIVR